MIIADMHKYITPLQFFCLFYAVCSIFGEKKKKKKKKIELY